MIAWQPFKVTTLLQYEWECGSYSITTHLNSCSHWLRVSWYYTGGGEGEREGGGKREIGEEPKSKRSILPVHSLLGASWMVTVGAKTSLPLAGREMLCTVASTPRYTTELDGT